MATGAETSKNRNGCRIIRETGLIKSLLFLVGFPPIPRRRTNCRVKLFCLLLALENEIVSRADQPVSGESRDLETIVVTQTREVVARVILRNYALYGRRSEGRHLPSNTI